MVVLLWLTELRGRPYADEVGLHDLVYSVVHETYRGDVVFVAGWFSVFCGSHLGLVGRTVT